MNKKFFLLSLFLLSLFFPLVATAASPTGDTLRLEERKEQILDNSQERQDLRQERREQVQENSEERQELRQERRDEIAMRHANRLGNRFSFYYQRLTTLISKFEAQLAELSAAGKDITAATAKLNEAKIALTSAKSLGDQAIAGFTAITPENYQDQQDQAIAARDQAQQAREKYVSTVQLLKETVQALRAGE